MRGMQLSEWLLHEFRFLLRVTKLFWNFTVPMAAPKCVWSKNHSFVHFSKMNARI